jgi:hypothetical protein
MSNPYSFIIELIEFFKTGATSQFLTKTVEKTDRQALRVVVIKVLAWLKCESKRKTVRSLSLNRDFQWCSTLIALVKADDGFRSLLVIDDNTLSLNPNIPEEESSKITAACASAYNPRLMR